MMIMWIAETGREREHFCQDRDGDRITGTAWGWKSNRNGLETGKDHDDGVKIGTVYFTVSLSTACRRAHWAMAGLRNTNFVSFF